MVDTIKQIFISMTYLVRRVIIKKWERTRDLRTLTAVSRLNGLRADNCFYTCGVDDAIMLDDVQFDLRRRRGNIKWQRLQLGKIVTVARGLKQSK